MSEPHPLPDRDDKQEIQDLIARQQNRKLDRRRSAVLTVAAFDTAAIGAAGVLLWVGGLNIWLSVAIGILAMVLRPNWKGPEHE